MEEELRKHRCCFTGHRPEKLHTSQQEIITQLEQEIYSAINSGFTTFISGMARGVDIWAAEIVLELRRQGHHIKLICASPFRGFEKNWPENWKNKYLEVLQAADLVKFISPQYYKACFQVRNKWMVDHSALVIAVFNGEPSGTLNTLRYAQSKSRIIRLIND